ncbi:uncharacterized protein LOC124806182 [Hydra vulgaris]|uniref:uncharacterized protein LOC124806182 n=1 Tax=Hydra vulgaris TaxID=6087 RepID=UPI001F5EA139|nr:uncharacterized protein LOC124806182 [Hydra vulgaris]
MSSKLRKISVRVVSKRLQQIFEEDTNCEIVNSKMHGELNNFPSTSNISTEDIFPAISENIVDNKSNFGTVGNIFSHNNDNFENEFDHIRNPYIDDDEDDDDDYETLSPDLTTLLADWAVQFSITLTALSSLLCILRLFHPSLPKDARTILKTKRNFIIELRAGGDYFYFGLINSLTITLNHFYDKIANFSTLYVQLNVDGLPLFKSSNISFWPILCLLQGFNIKKPVLVGLFCGVAKPNNLIDYFGDLVIELNKLGKGFLFREKEISIKTCSIICDAPARAFVKAVKGHNAYYGCDKCNQIGKYKANRMTYPLVDAPVRTDESFRLMHNDDHHLKIGENFIRSPFLDIDIGMVTQFPHDYMHLVCLGVQKKMIKLWLSGPLFCRLRSSSVESISNALIFLGKWLPTEYARKPRSLKEVSRWKATEFCQFLLYTGAVVLHNVLPIELYNNFMLLYVATFLLASPTYCVSRCSYSKTLLINFVNHFGLLYGQEMIVYNVHSLIHLADDVQQHGTLDKISGFAYENYLQHLKKMIRKPQHPLAQIIRRQSERDAVINDFLPDQKIKYRKQHNKGPCPDFLRFSLQYNEVYLPNFCLKTTCGNNCVKIENEICLVKNICVFDDITYIVYWSFLTKSNFFTYPCDSSVLGIFLVSHLDKVDRIAILDDKFLKCVLLQVDNGFVVSPLLHLL